MKKILKIVGIGFAVLIVAGLVFYGWASFTANRKLSRTFSVHTVDFPIPFAASEQEREPTEPAQPVAFERGKHLVQARYGCTGCHGPDFGGGVMIDAPAIGRILGSNLTSGSGSVTTRYRPADWDRIVRHGVRPDGTPSLMPSQDFRRMSDQELSDIIVFLENQPPVNKTVPPARLGPLGKILLATGRFSLSADLIDSHHTPHPRTPPEAALTVEFGRHLAATCTGCHRADLAGGSIVGGDPSWPPAANLTPSRDGLGEWTYSQFVTAMREGRRPDGTGLRPPMTEVIPFARKMTETELQALWSYLRSVDAVEGRE